MKAGLKYVYYTYLRKRYTKGSRLIIRRVVTRRYYNQEPELKY